MGGEADFEAVPGFHLARGGQNDRSVVGQDKRGRTHLRVNEAPGS